MHILFRVILLLSSVLMILLGIANSGYANDDHFTVIEIIAKFGKQPLSTQCWQCYHPKLYHWLVAQIWNVFSVESDLWKQLTAQLLNVSFGISTLIVIRKYILGLKFSTTIKLLVFALIAFNPRVISVFTQATNDGIIILLGNITLYATLKLFKTPSLKHSVILIASVVLGAMSKHNFGIFFLGTLITLVCLVFLHRNYLLSLSRGYLGTVLLIVVFTGAAMLTFNGYYKSLTEENKAFTYNTPLHELPHLYEYKGAYIPGINTIFSGYFKFHYFDLIKKPQTIEMVSDEHTKHLTSHFSQLYGRSQFLYFDHWPPQWQTFNPLMIKIGSITLAIAIVPAIILLVGVFIVFWSVLSHLLKWDLNYLRSNDYWVIAVFFIGYLMFSVLFSLYGRSYVFMKDIYLFPGLLTVIVPFCLGHFYFFSLLKNEALKKVYYGFVVFLITLYLIPVINLTIDLFADKLNHLG